MKKLFIPILIILICSSARANMSISLEAAEAASPPTLLSILNMTPRLFGWAPAAAPSFPKMEAAPGPLTARGLCRAKKSHR